MAQIGLKGFRYNLIDEATNKYKTLTGSKVPQIIGAIDSKASLNIASATLYTDDVLAEQCEIFTNGTLSLTVGDDDDTIFAELLGHEKGTDGEVIRKADDIAPYVGFGRVITKVVNKKYKYKVEFFPMVKFKPFIPDNKTKGENIEFSTASVEGTILALDREVNGIAKGTYEKHKTFDTEDEAVNYLETLLTPKA